MAAVGMKICFFYRRGVHVGRQRRGSAGRRLDQRHPAAAPGGRPAAGQEDQPRGVRVGAHAGLVHQQAGGHGQDALFGEWNYPWEYLMVI